MKPSTVKFREFAEKLIFIEAKASSSSTPESPESPGLFGVIDKLRPSFTLVVGALGFSALLARALTAASADVEWLHALQVKPDGSVEASSELAAKPDPKEMTEGKVVLLAEFFSLLVLLIGERLVVRLVHLATPELFKADLYFAEGCEREKS